MDFISNSINESVSIPEPFVYMCCNLCATQAKKAASRKFINRDIHNKFMQKCRTIKPTDAQSSYIYSIEIQLSQTSKLKIEIMFHIGMSIACKSIPVQDK